MYIIGLIVLAVIVLALVGIALTVGKGAKKSAHAVDSDRDPATNRVPGEKEHKGFFG